MNDDRPKRDSMSLEEASISNMGEIAAIVEVLERKGLYTKQDLYSIITEFRRKNPYTSFVHRTISPEECRQVSQGWCRGRGLLYEICAST